MSGQIVDPMWKYQDYIVHCLMNGWSIQRDQVKDKVPDEVYEAICSYNMRGELRDKCLESLKMHNTKDCCYRYLSALGYFEYTRTKLNHLLSVHKIVNLRLG
ncbi:MAG: hypothetical protein LBP59_10715 [Planctomycetaceae bacterium]|jgi:hypothetical protein|nr:hypothetical protein [Planctomycetaceae bacterium]